MDKKFHTGKISCLFKDIRTHCYLCLSILDTLNERTIKEEVKSICDGENDSDFIVTNDEELQKEEDPHACPERKYKQKERTKQKSQKKPQRGKCIWYLFADITSSKIF